MKKAEGEMSTFNLFLQPSAFSLFYLCLRDIS